MGEICRKVTLSPTIFVFSRERWGISPNVALQLVFLSFVTESGGPAREKKVGDNFGGIKCEDVLSEKNNNN